MKKTIIFLFAVLLGSSILPAQPAEQTFQTISGVVRDARTRQTIAFASVFIPGTTIGTVANLDGVFSLKVQKSLGANRFSISHLGYLTGTFEIEASLEGGKVFFLEPHSVTLPPVIVRPDDPRELVRNAIDKISDNYPDQDQRLTGFYREAIKQRRDYVSISEAVVEVDQTSYGFRMARDRVKIIQARRSGEVKKMDTLLVKLQGGPHVSMLLDVVKNPDVILDKEFLQYYEYELEDVVVIDGRSNYLVSFKPMVTLPFPLYFGRLYIDVESLAFTMAEFSLDLSDREKAARNFIVRKPLSLRFTATRTSYLVTYKHMDGKFYLNYVRNEMEFFADWRRKIFRTGYTIMSEMAITKRVPETAERISRSESFRPRNILADMVPQYFDPDFWGAYNVIEPEESIESAIQKFNKRFEE
ncbi:MAG: carboxypeptidase-like regulatory domain-containing protein [Bacteroides sp.]|jgi:hypothetical protein|nr:carboxypeptidase-like regulatory domain-containing protein [Bacteroides sp.]